MAGGIPGGYDLPGGVPPPPVKKPGGSNWVIGGLVGCGVLAVLVFVVFAIAVWRVRGNKEFSNAVSGVMSASSCGQSMVSVRTAIQNYRDDHGGKYPPSLQALVPGYLDSSGLGCGSDSSGHALPMDYVPPKADAPADTIVVSVRSGEMSMSVQNQTMHQVIYTRLLKDGSVVSDQEARTLLHPPGDTETK